MRKGPDRLVRMGGVGSAVLLCAIVAACGQSGGRVASDPAVADSSVGVEESPVSATPRLAATSAAPSATIDASAAPAAAASSVSQTAPPTDPSRKADPPDSGSGEFSTAGLASAAAVHGRLVRFAVQVERDVPVDPMDFATQVYATLTDPRGWQGVDGVTLAAVADPSAAAFIVTLATPKTTDRLCAPLDTGGYLDCFNGSRAVINSDRWLLGAQTWGTDLTGYRHQVVNHEVGHALGHGHAYCPGPGAPAPVMQQQTISLRTCTPNAWPSVTGG